MSPLQGFDGYSRCFYFYNHVSPDGLGRGICANSNNHNNNNHHNHHHHHNNHNNHNHSQPLTTTHNHQE